MPHVAPQHHRRRHHGRNGRVQQAPQPQAQQKPRRKMVLVLEDHASIGGLIAGLLREEGYRTARAWDPQEAIRLARGRAPDLILLDLNLAYQDGLVPLHALQADEATRRTPVLVVAAAGAALNAADEGLVQEVVRKPFDIDVMLNAVRKALGDPVVDVEPRHFDAQDYFLNGY